MRAFLAILTFVVLAISSCAGDSSSLMSVWNDGSPAVSSGGAVGGQGGQSVVSLGGSVGGGGGGGSGGAVSGGGSINVPGGKRDLATAMCTATSGNTCPVPAAYLTCLEGNCGGSLIDCHYSDGFSVAAGGRCQGYANCMLACPCDGGRQRCEDICTSSYVNANPDCSTCLYTLLICSSRYGCTIPTTCSASSTGS